jgi:hypothetical protein
MERAAIISSMWLVSRSSIDPNSSMQSSRCSDMLKPDSDTKLLQACAWERVIGLVRGKAA